VETFLLGLIQVHAAACKCWDCFFALGTAVMLNVCVCVCVCLKCPLKKIYPRFLRSQMFQCRIKPIYQFYVIYLYLFRAYRSYFVNLYRYVGNIHLQVTDAILQEVFQSIGPVEGCKLIRKEKVDLSFF
jgi:hypothetical protein